MFELTGAVSYILPIMLTVIVAKWVAEYMEPNSIYDALIKLYKFPFLPSDCHIKKGLVGDVMTIRNELLELKLDSTIEEIIYATTQPYKGFPICDDQGVLLGYCLKSTLLKCVNQPQVDLKVLMDKSPVTINPEMPLEICVELFRKMGLRYCLVTFNGTLKGIITKKDLLSFID